VARPPRGTKAFFDVCLEALSYVAVFDGPEAALEILDRHVDDVERKVVAPNHLVKYYLHRLEWVLAAALNVEGKRDAYVAEAKGLMKRATRDMRAMQLEDWDGQVCDSV
jgi:hypothetical protein